MVRRAGKLQSKIAAGGIYVEAQRYGGSQGSPQKIKMHTQIKN
jgi:hypothetical protein